MRLVLLALAAVLAALLAAAPASAAGPREVLYVGNNWEGTADVIDPTRFERLARINIVPDLEERLAEIRMDPERQAYFIAVREGVGEGNDQLVDDMYSSPDGTMLYVSRPSLSDVVGIDLRTRKIVWRTKIDGNRSDHMGISPDGKQLLVSASTARVVVALESATGKITGRFPSGDQPHENTYSADGSLIFHASIGTVFTPTDDPALDATKGERVFEIVDAKTLKVIEKIDIRRKLDEFGRSDLSNAVRPMTLSPDEKFVYFQVSFFHGFVEYSLEEDKVTRIANLPISEEASRKRREEYLLDSAHHGLTMSPKGDQLCVAGTVSDYAALTDRATFATKVVTTGSKPYWSTNSGDGKYCFVSFSGDDSIVAISYADAKEVARVKVGDHPQRMRMGKLADGALDVPATGAAGVAIKPALRVSMRPRSVRARRAVTVRLTVTTRRGGRNVPVAGARVWVGGKRTTTDRRGRATIRKRRGFERVRSYRVRVTRTGYTPGAATLRAISARR